MIIHKLLQHASFGKEKEEKGLTKLLEQRVIENAYPLHDGSATIPSDTTGPNDRRVTIQGINQGRAQTLKN